MNPQENIKISKKENNTNNQNDISELRLETENEMREEGKNGDTPIFEQVNEEQLFENQNRSFNIGENR